MEWSIGEMVTILSATEVVWVGKLDNYPWTVRCLNMPSRYGIVTFKRSGGVPVAMIVSSVYCEACGDAVWAALCLPIWELSM